MKLIIDFYKNLDAFNMILFWGVIIVIILLLIFSFILINKNNKSLEDLKEINKNSEIIQNFLRKQSKKLSKENTDKQSATREKFEKFKLSINQ